jgi:hypothetical protein
MADNKDVHNCFKIQNHFRCFNQHLMEIAAVLSMRFNVKVLYIQLLF